MQIFVKPKCPTKWERVGRISLGILVCPKPEAKCKDIFETSYTWAGRVFHEHKTNNLSILSCWKAFSIPPSPILWKGGIKFSYHKFVSQLQQNFSKRSFHTIRGTLDNLVRSTWVSVWVGHLCHNAVKYQRSKSICPFTHNRLNPFGSDLGLITFTSEKKLPLARSRQT